MENEVNCRNRAASFLKVVDGDFSKHLIIPPTFGKNFNGKIPPWFIIETGETRKCWRVDVEYDENGGLKFTNGWNDFVKAQALELGNFLVFHYKRNLIVEVTIYDKDGLEKTARQTSEFEEHNFQESEHQQRSSTTYHAEDASDDVVLVDQASDDEERQVVGSTKRKVARASMMGSGARFSITWKWTQNIYYYLTIPRALVLEKKLSNKTGIMLMDQQRKSWFVKFTTRLNGRVDLTQGWREFLNDNKFRAGDTVTFEFLSDNLIQVQVESPILVDHASQSEKRCKTARSSDLTCEPVEPAATCTVNCKSPEALGSTGVDPGFIASSFSKIVTMSVRGTYLHIPAKVAKEQKLDSNKTIVLCDEEGKHWELRIDIRRSDGRFSLTRGWNEFQKRNKIMVGDTLNFKFVAECMMKVDIIRTSEVHYAAKEAVVKQEMDIS